MTAFAPLFQTIEAIAALDAGGPEPFWGLNADGFSENEGPLYASDPWDTFHVGGYQLPGECTLIAGDVVRLEINSKKGKGEDIGRITASGWKAGQFQVRCQIATPAQWLELKRIRDLIFRPPGKISGRPITFTVAHPALAFVHVDIAVLEGIAPPQDGKLEGAKDVMFYFRWSLSDVPKNNVTKSSTPPALPEDPKKPKSSGLQNGTPDPPESSAENVSTSGPPYKPQKGVS
ncbi:MAG TPA: hypothetical protein VHO06_12535 [Polyangia bacterium]|nr:hypothetical protein [Polyangia bacterium]